MKGKKTNQKIVPQGNANKMFGNQQSDKSVRAI